MVFLNVIDVAAEDCRLHVAGTDHVIRHQQKLLVLNPLVFVADRRQFGDGPHHGIVLEQQMQHRHEVRLTRTKAAVQVARFAVRRFDR